MDEQIKQIAERLRGLRDAMELTPNDIANECGIDKDEYGPRRADVRRRTQDEHLLPDACRQGHQRGAHQGLQVPVAGCRIQGPQGRPLHRDRRAQRPPHALQHACRTGVQPRHRRHPAPEHRRQGSHPDPGRQHLLQLQPAPRHEGPRRQDRALPGNHHVNEELKMKNEEFTCSMIACPDSSLFVLHSSFKQILHS